MAIYGQFISNIDSLMSDDVAIVDIANTVAIVAMLLMEAMVAIVATLPTVAPVVLTVKGITEAMGPWKL